MDGVNVSVAAVLVAALSSMVIGSLWYGPVFGKQWSQMTGVTQEQMKKSGSYGMVLAVVRSLLKLMCWLIWCFYHMGSSVIRNY